MRHAPSLSGFLIVAAGIGVAMVVQKFQTMWRASAQRERLHSSQERVAAKADIGGGTPAPARPRPRLHIHGQAADAPYDEVMGKLRLAPHQEVVDAVLIAPEDAARSFDRQMAWGFGIVFAVIAGFLMALAIFAARPAEQATIVPLFVLAILVLAAVIPFAYARNRERFPERMERTTLPAPAGSTMRLDDRGIDIAGRGLLPWAALALDTVDLMKAITKSESFYVIDALFLSSRGETIELDRNSSANGHAFLDNVFERLCPAE